MSFLEKLAGATMATVMSLTVIAPSSAIAAIREEKKIGQFGSPVEWRTSCVKWAKPWVGAKICIGHKYQNLQHEFFLVANGPDLGQAAKRVVQEALGVAASAAVGTGLLVPSPEPGARIGAAIAAGKAAFVGYLAARGLERLASQYDVRIAHRTHW